VPQIEAIFGAVVAVAGVAIAVAGTGMGYVSHGVPESGFFPVWVGLLLIVSGSALALTAWRNPSTTERIESGQLVAIGAGGAFLVVLSLLGSMAATVAYVAATVWMTRRHSLPVAVAAALIAALVIYFTFQVWLLVPLPRGWLSGMA